jgi:hypothetical protein
MCSTFPLALRACFVDWRERDRLLSVWPGCSGILPSPGDDGPEARDSGRTGYRASPHRHHAMPSELSLLRAVRPQAWWVSEGRYFSLVSLAINAGDQVLPPSFE